MQLRDIQYGLNVGGNTNHRTDQYGFLRTANQEIRMQNSAKLYNYTTLSSLHKSLIIHEENLKEIHF